MIETMHILNLSFVNVGGAGIAAVRFHRLLLQHGMTSEMLFYKTKGGEIEDSIKGINPSFFWKLNRVIVESLHDLSLRLKGYSPQDKYAFFAIHETNSFVREDDITQLVTKAPDVIVLHWVSGFVNARLAFFLSEHYNCPVVWRFNDMAPFTGGCHYPFDCVRYEVGCGLCPGIKSATEDDITRANWAFKSHFLNAANVYFVASTTEIHEQVSRSKIASYVNIEKIFPSLEVRDFSGEGPTGNEPSLINDNTLKIVLVVASSFLDERKGFSQLAEVIDHLKRLADPAELSEFMFVFVSNDGSLPLEINGVNKVVFSAMSPKDLWQLYTEASLFLSCSIQDAGPMTLCEAILAGTPAVSFNLGIAKDVVIDGETGYRVELYDTLGMATAALAIMRLQEEELQELRRKTRLFGENFFSTKREAERYTELFNSIRKKRHEQ